jgi:diketogulonate reductase-like aldo/keto reductase
MEIPIKKLKCGFEISALGLGTWRAGGMLQRQKTNDDDKDILAIRKAIKLGFTRFDTAEIYADGSAEVILGKGIKGTARKNLFITSKVSKPNLKYDDVLRACEESLRRLGLNYLDLYLIHAPNYNVPIKETMKAFDRLAEEGMIKNIGVSNFGTESFKKAQACARNKIVLNQVHYNLIFREPFVEGLLDFCQANDIMLEAWRPIEEGSLANSGIEILDRMAEKYGKTQVQIAINWLVCQKNVVAVAKSSSINHLKEDFGSVGWKINKIDIDLLAKKFPIKLSVSNAVRLG